MLPVEQLYMIESSPYPYPKRNDSSDIAEYTYDIACEAIVKNAVKYRVGHITNHTQSKMIEDASISEIIMQWIIFHTLSTFASEVWLETIL